MSNTAWYAVFFAEGFLLGAACITLGWYLHHWSMGKMAGCIKTIPEVTLANAFVGTDLDDYSTEVEQPIQTECEVCGKTLSRIAGPSAGTYLSFCPSRYCSQSPF